MPHNITTLLREVQVFISKLEVYVKGSSVSSLANDELRSDAILHKFVQIAEALKRIERTSEDAGKRVESLREIADFRNVIVHDYDQVDIRIVWDAAVNHVPILKQQINAWADELGMEPSPGQTL